MMAITMRAEKLARLLEIAANSGWSLEGFGQAFDGTGEGENNEQEG